MADKLLLDFLDEMADKAQNEIRRDKILTEKNVIPIIMQSQRDYILYIEENMLTKREFNEYKVITKQEFNEFKTEFREFAKKVEMMGEKLSKDIDKATVRYLTFCTICMGVIGILVNFKK